MKYANLAILCLLLASAVAAGTPPRNTAAKAVTVSESDSGKKITLSVNQRLVVRLSSNPSTGYSWKMKNTGPKTLRMSAKPKFAGPNDNRPGSGGTMVYTFVGGTAGRAKLTFTYQRSWEKKAPAQTVKFDVKVEAGNKK